ncbi:MAG TPA: alpha-amylase family glycosyl hydrolase [Hyphomicrobiaceae bacterium]|nr:alpha-amylase family glycosyl hydrolase [Hyphomicrobiaceae bacterium]
MAARKDATRSSGTAPSKATPAIPSTTWWRRSLVPDTTTFRLYAPTADGPLLILDQREPIALDKLDDGFWAARINDVGEGARYKFRVGGLEFPDLASRQQDGDSNGCSILRRPLERRSESSPRPWHETVLCEVHVGTATPEGTFAALASKLGHFRDAGYTCLEIMPVNAFPGTRNWGYDGTLVFAPATAYGSPEDLRALVDRAHELGLTIILDVVYNHFGDTYNYARDYLPAWFSEKVETPWGPGINFENEQVRRFYCENAAMWLSEYDFDGLRFDAVHEMKTDGRNRFLAELADAAHAAKPTARLIIENIKNSFHWLERDEQNQPLHYLAQWNDDMHHVLTYLTTREGRPTGYDDTSKDPYADLEKALADGFVHDPSEGDGSDGRTRGGQGALLPPDAFITYVQNHDQIGNRGDSKRIAERVSPAQTDFMHFVKFLAPQVPLCFMGDEANLATPFPFFFDLPDDVAQRKRDDRYDQLRNIFKHEVGPKGLPDPNADETFRSAKLDWTEYERADRRASLERFCQLAAWRRERLWPLSATPCLDAKTARQGDALIISWVFDAGALSMALNPTDTPAELICQTTAPISTGSFRQDGSRLHLGAWSAVAW